jgi:hypothetical protein
MTLSGIIYIKTSLSPGKSRAVPKQGRPKCLQNTPEDDLDTFCDIQSTLVNPDLVKKFRIPFNLFRIRKRSGVNKFCPNSKYTD